MSKQNTYEANNDKHLELFREFKLHYSLMNKNYENIAVIRGFYQFKEPYTYINFNRDEFKAKHFSIMDKYDSNICFLCQSFSGTFHFFSPFSFLQACYTSLTL